MNNTITTNDLTEVLGETITQRYVNNHPYYLTTDNIAIYPSREQANLFDVEWEANISNILISLPAHFENLREMIWSIRKIVLTLHIDGKLASTTGDTNE